jgi:hypothetical protein
MSLLRLGLSRRIIAAGLLTPLLVFTAIFATITVRELTRPEPAEAILGVDIPGLPSPCDLVGNNTAKTVCEGVTDPIGTAAGAVGLPSPAGIIKDAVDSVARTLANQFVQLEAEAVAYSLKSMVVFINTVTTPNLADAWFVQQYRLLLGIVGFLAVALFFLRGTNAARNKDGRDAAGAGFSFVGYAWLSGLLPGILAVIVIFFDDVLAAGWIKLFAENSQHSLEDISHKMVDSGTSPAIPVLLLMIILGFGVIGSFCLIVLMFYRLQVLFLLVLAELFALAMNVGGKWGVNALRRVTMLNVAFISVKLVVVIAMTVSIGFLQNLESWQAALVGSVSLFMVPIVFVWWIHFVGQHRSEINGKLTALVVMATRKVR